MSDAKNRYIQKLLTAAVEGPRVLAERIEKRIVYDDGPPLDAYEPGPTATLWEALVAAQRQPDTARGFREAIAQLIADSTYAALRNDSPESEQRLFFIASRVLSLAAAVDWQAADAPVGSVLEFLQVPDASERAYPLQVELLTAPGLEEVAAPRLVALEALAAMSPDRQRTIESNGIQLWEDLEAEPLEVRVRQRLRLLELMAKLELTCFCEKHHLGIYIDLTTAGGAMGNLAGFHVRMDNLHGHDVTRAMIESAIKNTTFLGRILANKPGASQADYFAQLCLPGEPYANIRAFVDRQRKDPAADSQLSVLRTA